MDKHTPHQHQMDWNGKIVRFFINNSRLVILLFLFIVLGGVATLLSLRREGFPPVSPKVVAIQTIYPGAAAGEVERQVTKVIESSLQDVKDLKNVSSVSSGSFSNVVAYLEERVDLDAAVQEIQSKVQEARAELPTDVESPKVTTFSVANPDFTIGITSGTDESNIADQASFIADELETVSGVKEVVRQNEPGRRVEIAYRPNDLRARGVAVSTVSQIIVAANATFPAGVFQEGTQDRSVVVVGAYGSIEEIANTVVGFDAVAKRPVQLKDIADVRYASTEKEIRFGYTKGDDVIVRSGYVIDVMKKSSADIVSLREALLKKIDQLKSDKKVPDNIDIVMLNDQGLATQKQVDEIVGSAIGDSTNWWLLGGFQLVFILTLIFVNYRAAIVALVSIPLSLLMTFISLYFFGIQLNTLVLFSLILVLGLIVDPATVMIEAIQRNRDRGLGAKEAVLEAARRYAGSLFMAVVTSFIVFFPFLTIGGVFGQIIRYIPLTVIPALVASYIVPIMILPWFSMKLLKSNKKGVVADEDDPKSLTKAAQWLITLNTWVLAKVYRQIGVLVGSFLLVALSFTLVTSGKIQVVQFSTANDNEFITVSGTYARGLNEAEQQRIRGVIEQRIAAQDGIQSFFYETQGRGGFTVFATLQSKATRYDNGRDLGSKKIVASLQDELKNAAPLDDVLVKEAGVGGPVSQYEIQTQFYSNDPVVLERAAKDVGDFLRKQENVVRVDDGFTGQQVSALQVILDRQKVEAVGLSSIEVALQMRAYLGEDKVTTVSDNDTQATDDVVILNGQMPTQADTLRDLIITTRAGGVVKLGDIASIQEQPSPSSILRYDGKRYIEVQARLSDTKYTFDVQNKLNAYLTDEKLDQLGITDRANRGDADDIAESFSQLYIALGAAILLTFIGLVIQFRSFTQPLIILFTIPLALIGVFPALWLTGSDLGFLELLGITILVGIVENVAIFLQDYANQIREEKKMSAKSAIALATGVRYRPIMLTTLSSLGGLLPLAITSDFWRGLSSVLVAGIAVSGLFSLVVIPILYTWIEALRIGVKKRLRRVS